MFISKDGIKPKIILDKWYEWIFFIFPKMIFLLYPTMLLAAPILLAVYLFFAFLPVPFPNDPPVDYFFKVLRLWFLYWIAFIIWGRKSINRLKLLANIYHRKILYYLCFLLINLISYFLGIKILLSEPRSRIIPVSLLADPDVVKSEAVLVTPYVQLPSGSFVANLNSKLGNPIIFVKESIT